MLTKHLFSKSLFPQRSIISTTHAPLSLLKRRGKLDSSELGMAVWGSTPIKQHQHAQTVQSRNTALTNVHKQINRSFFAAVEQAYLLVLHLPKR